jgi:16S rRNA (guanine966-N2)-methyltransferase
MVLDLFAGSGQLGIEALSRGAKFAVFVDTERQAQECIRQNLAVTRLAQQARVAAMPAESYLASCKERFDIALLDPPYQSGLLQTVLPQVAARMQPEGVIVCESERDEQLPECAGDFVLYKTYRYGRVKVTTYRKQQEEVE